MWRQRATWPRRAMPPASLKQCGHVTPRFDECVRRTCLCHWCLRILGAPTRLREDADLHPPTCLRNDAGLRLTCLNYRGVSLPAHVSSRRVFARHVFGKCLRPPTCLRDDVGLRLTCLNSGRVFARPRVFAKTRIFGRRVFGKCLRPPTCLREDAGLRLTCLREVSSPAHVSS